MFFVPLLFEELGMRKWNHICDVALGSGLGAMVSMSLVCGPVVTSNLSVKVPAVPTSSRVPLMRPEPAEKVDVPRK